MPNILEHYFTELLEVFSKLECVKVDQADHLAPGLHYLIRDRRELRIVLLNYKNTSVHDLSEIIFVKIWKLLLRNNGLNYVEG